MRMLAELQTIDLGDVTLTQSMIMLGAVIMIAVQLFRASLMQLWPAGPDEIKKPLTSLVSVSLSMLIFYAMAIESWLMGGIVIGLAAGGGYEFTKNMAGLVKKKVVNAGNGKAAANLSMLLLLCAMLIAGGCISAQPNPRADLVASQKIFAATVDSLTALQQAGKFSAGQAEQISIFVDIGDGLLDQWLIAVKSGVTSPDIIKSFQEVLNKLIEYQIQKGGDL